ncbi:MAG: lytic transglycosylase domain-containing protein [Bryobacteraceae bacterium]|nr:lytic transglycosylase domain-containing protein [Bryobacteraceae bacterium]
MRIILKNKSMVSCFLAAVFAAVPAALPSDLIRPGTAIVRADPKSGKLVRRVLAPKAGPTAAPAANQGKRALVAELVNDAAARHEVDPLLVHSVIEAESNYNLFAVSPKGAEGLMQLMPGTARELGVRNSFDARQNIEAGVKYLRQLQQQYGDDRLALAAYNAGPAAVAKYRWVPPYKETQQYVARITERYAGAKRAEQSKQAAKQAAAEPPRPRLEQFVDDQGRLHLRTR